MDQDEVTQPDDPLADEGGHESPEARAAEASASDESVDSAPRGSTREPGGGARLLSWPPPDLARTQGELWSMIGLAAVGGIVLVAPLLWAVATEHEFWSLGPFGETWWILAILIGTGLFMLVAVLAGVDRLLRRVARAAGQGYGRLTLLEVVTDAGRDMGFLIQGARHYGVLDVEVRNRLIKHRIVGGLAYFLAALWIPLGFTVALLVAARGVHNTTMVWILSLGPPAILLAIGAVLRWLEVGIVRRARHDWILSGGMPARLEDEVKGWNRRFASVEAELSLDPSAREQGFVFRLLGAAVLLGAALVAAPVISLAFTAALGPQVAGLTAPDFVELQQDAAGIELFRPFVLEPDDDVNARDAGNALNALLYVGGKSPADPILLGPTRSYQNPWFPEDPDGVGGFFAATWVLDVLERAGQGRLTAVERRYLTRVAAHPAHGEMGTVARAARADIVGTRWRLPFPDTLTLLSLPIPSFGSLRDAGLARVAKAAMEVATGRPDAAETSIREVISVGFLLMDEGPVLTDGLIGESLVEAGGDALEALYRGTGDADLAEALAWARRSTGEAASLGRIGITSPDIQALVKEMSEVVIQDDLLRGLRWDLFGGFHTLSACLNPHKVVFGPGSDYDEWLADARQSLVRFPSEQDFFALAQGGWLGSNVEVSTTPGWMRQVLILSLGGQRAPGSCATLVSGMR